MKFHESQRLVRKIKEHEKEEMSNCNCDIVGDKQFVVSQGVMLIFH